MYMHMSVLQWNFVSDDPMSQHIIRFMEVFVRTFCFYLILPIIMASQGYLYFSQEEGNSASGLKESIAKMTAAQSKLKRR